VTRSRQLARFGVSFVLSLAGVTKPLISEGSAAFCSIGAESLASRMSALRSGLATRLRRPDQPFRRPWHQSVLVERSNTETRFVLEASAEVRLCFCLASRQG
jgi:hypothetical protein